MNFGKTLVVQAWPGIGDMIWYLPYLRAIAAHSSHNKVSVFTKSRSLSKDWLAHDPIIDTIHYGERRGLFSNVRHLRQEKFETVWVLHRSFSYAFVAALAGIKNRYGFGYGLQKHVLNRGKTLEEPLRHHHTIDQLKTLLQLNGLDPQPQNQTIFMPGSVIAQARQYIPESGFSIALGIGGSEEAKRWPLDYFVQFTLDLNARGYDNIFICGGPAEDKDATYIVNKVMEHQGRATKITALPIDQSIAFMGLCDLYVGNDSGMLSAAACRGTPALGLFAPTPILTYSPLLHGLRETTMQDITVESVMKTLDERNLLENKSLKHSAL